jgi:hypothetical protein
MSQRISGPTLTRAKQSKRHCPPPAAAVAAAIAAADVHGFAAANALTLPSMPPCHRLPNNSAALRCHFLCGNGAGGAKLFGKARGVFFLKMDLIRLYVQSKTIFYYLFLVTKTVEEAGSEHTNNVLLLGSPFARKSHTC